MLIVVSDLHVGATTALWPEGMEDGDGAPLAQNAVQREIWQYWLEFIALAKAEAKRRKVKPALLINGDLVQGSHADRDGQLVTDDSRLQAKAAKAALRPLIAIADAQHIYVTRGTPFHDGRTGGTADQIAEEIGAVKDERNGHYAHYVTLLRLDDKRLAAMHHTSNARVYPMTPLQKIIDEAYRNNARWGVPIPDIYIRSHVHGFNHYDDGLGRHAFTTDAWQVPGDFAHKVVPGALPIVGGLWLSVDNGVSQWQTYRRLVSTAMPFQA